MRSIKIAGLALLAVLVAVLVAPQVVSAHEKWFVDGGSYPVRWELLFSWPVLAALVVGAGALVVLAVLRRVVGDPFWPNPDWLKPINSSAQAVVGIQTAISLVFMTVQGWLFAPKLNLPDGVGGILLSVIMLFVAWTLITGWLSRLGGGLLIMLVVVALLIFPPAFVLEQALFVGIGGYFLIMGRGLFRPAGEVVKRLDAFWSKYKRHAIPIMRIGTGVSILTLAFTEKLLNPDLALAFLRDYPNFNFMHLLGFDWFSNELFIFAAGAVETAVGLMLIAGILPRVVILFMWVPFNIAIPLLPPEELLGHLPILAVMYAIFLESPKGEVAV
ncbi:MAG: hypothetical protein ABIQ44_12880 [Chloroflexia bacterium]